MGVDKGTSVPLFKPLVPRVQQIKIGNLTLNRLPIVEFVKKMVYLGAHYSERQTSGTNGLICSFEKQMLQAADTGLLNPLVPKAHKSERKKSITFPLHIKPVKVSSS